MLYRRPKVSSRMGIYCSLHTIVYTITQFVTLKDYLLSYAVVLYDYCWSGGHFMEGQALFSTCSYTDYIMT